MFHSLTNATQERRNSGVLIQRLVFSVRTPGAGRQGNRARGKTASALLWKTNAIHDPSRSTKRLTSPIPPQSRYPDTGGHPQSSHVITTGEFHQPISGRLVAQMPIIQQLIGPYATENRDHALLSIQADRGTTAPQGGRQKVQGSLRVLETPRNTSAFQQQRQDWFGYRQRERSRFP
jgi:hypothetical protein